MSNFRDRIDLDAYLRTRVTIVNDEGGRGYEHGIRVFHCPLCGDHARRGWVSVLYWGAGCFNLGCPAEPRLDGGAVEWVRRVEGFTTRGRAWAHLSRFMMKPSSVPLPPKPVVKDWCDLPAGIAVASTPGLVAERFRTFVGRQWGLRLPDISRWSLRGCTRGAHAWRVVIPIIEQARPIAFQSRTIHEGHKPKYLISRHGPRGEPGAECGRAASAIVFNLDAVIPGASVLLVEGAGDVMAWERSRTRVAGDSRAVETAGGPDGSGETPPAVGLLGVALTPEKMAMLHRKLSGGRVIVALDAELPAQRRAVAHVDDLMAWGIPADLGHWVGGKDAGSGARLAIDAGPRSLRDRIAQRLGVS